MYVHVWRSYLRYRVCRTRKIIRRILDNFISVAFFSPQKHTPHRFPNTDLHYGRVVSTIYMNVFDIIIKSACHVPIGITGTSYADVCRLSIKLYVYLL